MKAQCPLLATRPVQALNPTTLRITNERQRRVMSPKARGLSFQLREEECKAAPDLGS